ASLRPLPAGTISLIVPRSRIARWIGSGERGLPRNMRSTLSLHGPKSLQPLRTGEPNELQGQPGVRLFFLLGIKSACGFRGKLITVDDLSVAEFPCQL